MVRASTVRRLFLSFVVFNLLIFPAWADVRRQYDVPRLPVSAALVEFARQSDISFIRPKLSHSFHKANAVRGHFTLEEGLRQLLKGTGFTFKILSPTAVKVMHRPKKIIAPDTSGNVDDFLPKVMEEVKVTATRRADFVDKLPYGMSVMSGTTLERLYGGSSNNALFEMIGLSATNQGDSRSKLFIRGLSDGAFSGRTQALVTTYLDDSRMNYNAPEPSLKLVDIASVQVLRGPQGTLYGSGALGGIYRIVTNKPQADRFESKMTTTYKITEGGAPSQQYTAMLNIPVIPDRLAIRGVGYYERSGGYINDVRLHLHNINSRIVYGGRFVVSLDIQDWIHLTAGINFQSLAAHDTNYYNAALGPFARNNYRREPHDDKLKQYYLTLKADLSWADLVSNISWFDRDLDNFYDGTFAVPKLSGLPLIPSVFEDDRHIKAISSETHLNSAGGSDFEWLAGVFLSHRSENVVTNLVVPGSGQMVGFGPTDVLFTEKLEEKLDEIALFGETTYFLTQRLAVTGGLRWFHYGNSAVSRLKNVGFRNFSTAVGEQQKNGLIPKFTLSFYASDTRLYYLQIAEGYRLGGINLKGPTVVNTDGDAAKHNGTARKILTTFNSDSLLSAEIGFKNRFLDGRLHFNGAIFFMDWKNIQSDQFDVIGLPIIGNIGNGRVIGGEVEIAFRPVQDLQFHANATWNSPELTRINTKFGTGIGAVKDGFLPGAPTVILNLSGQYGFDLGSEVRAMIDFSYSYVGPAHLLFKAGASRQSDGYHLGSLRFEVSKDVWRVTLFIDNFFNSSANSFAFGNPFSLNEINQVTPLRPRSFGLRLSWAH